MESATDESDSENHGEDVGGDGETVSERSHQYTTTDDEDDDMERIATEDRDHITMSVTVDVSGMSERSVAVLERLAQAYEQSFEEVVAKNRDYSWSFLKTGCKLAASDADPFDNAVRSIIYGLLTRTGDKRERLVENVYGQGDASVSDEPAVTAREAANYYQFIAFVLEHPQLASSFLTTDSGGSHGI